MLPCEICSYCNSSPFVGNLYFSPTLHACRISLCSQGSEPFRWCIWVWVCFYSRGTFYDLFQSENSGLSLVEKRTELYFWLFPSCHFLCSLFLQLLFFFRFWTSWAGSLIFFYLLYLFLLPSISVLYPIFWGGFLNFIFQLFYWVLHFRCHLLISNSFCCCYSPDEYFFLKRSPAKTCFFPVAFYLFVPVCHY